MSPKSSISKRHRAATTDAAAACRTRVRSCLALGFTVASLLVSGCTPERSRGKPATSVRVASARAARTADARPSAVERRGEPVGAELDPGANEEFDSDLLLDVEDALATVNENAFATLIKKEQVLVDGKLVRKEKTAHPDNCRRWRSLRRRGYAPKSALARQVNAGALVRCGSLEFLARAGRSRVSHVRNLLVGAGPSSLPAIVASALSPLASQARDRAVLRGATLAEFVSTARIVQSELPGRLSIAEPASQSRVILNAEAWGDINSDGIEDLVLSVLNTSDDGTYFDLRLMQVTRPSASAPLAVLAVME